MIVYYKSALNWQRENRSTNAGRFFTARHIRPTPTPGRQNAALILDIRKGGYYKQQVSPKRRCNDNRRDLPHGSQPWRTRQPQVSGGQHFRRETLTMQAVSLQCRFRVPFFGSQPEKRARNGPMMEAQPFEKMRLSQHLCFAFV